MLPRPQQPGLRVRFTNGAKLRSTFPDQFESWADVGLGCDLGDDAFDGTVFRLPLRSREAAAASEISRQSYGLDEAKAMLEHFRQAADGVLLFLRNVTAVHVSLFDDDGPKPLFAVAAAELELDTAREATVDDVFDLARTQQRQASDAVRRFGDACATKAEFGAGWEEGLGPCVSPFSREALPGDLSLESPRGVQNSQESVPTHMLWDGELISRLEVSRREWTLSL